MDSKFKKNFLKGSAAATIGTVSSMVFHFASIMLLTRHMPKDEFGLYALVLVITYLFSIVGGLGLEYTLVRYEAISKDSDRQSVLFPILILRGVTLAIISVFFILSGNFLLNLFDKRLTAYVFSLTLLSIINSFRDLLFNYLQGRNLFRRFAIVQTTAAASRVLMIVIYLWMNKLSLDSLIFIEIITSIFPLVFLLVSVPAKELFNFSSNTEKYKELIKFSLPLYINHILTFAYDRITIFMVGGLLTPVSVASYDVAGKIPDSLKRIFASFTIVFFPGMSNLLADGNKKDALALMNKSLIIFSNVICFGVLISFLFSQNIISLLFSSSYSESGIGFALLMANFCLRALSNIMGYSLVSAGYSAVPMKANVISSIISIAGGFLLIPIYGFMGAIYAVLIMSIVAQFSYTYFLVKAEMRPDTYRYSKPIILLVPAIAIYMLMDIQLLSIKLSIILCYMILSVIFIEELRNAILNKIIRGNIDSRSDFVSRGSSMKIIMIDPLIGNDYAACLSSGLTNQGAEVQLIVPANRSFNIPQNFTVLKWGPSKEKIPGGKLKKFYLYNKYLYRLFRHIQKEKPDIVHFQFFRRNIEIFFFLFLSFTKIKLVFTAHNILPHEMKRIDHFYFSLIYRNADRIIVHSASIKDKLLKNFNVNPRKIHIVPHGNFDFYLPQQLECKSDSRKKFGFSDEDNVILFFGLIREYKGLDILIKAFNIAASKNNRLKLIIGGRAADTETKTKYSGLVNSSPYRDRINCSLDFVPFENVPSYFSASDVVMLPYRNIDHSGIVHLAFSFSKPMIASDVGDFRETIEQNNAGFIIEENTPECIADCINEVFLSGSLERIGANMDYLNKTRFSWDNIAGLTLKLYKNGNEIGIHRAKHTAEY